MASLSALASRHVSELLQAYPSCRPVNPERSVIDLPLELPAGQRTTLRISLSPLFPQDRPAICVVTPVRHPSIDGTGRLHIDALDRWDYRVPERSSLLQLVADCVALLQATPSSNATAGGMRYSNSGGSLAQQALLGGPRPNGLPGVRPLIPPQSGSGGGTAAGSQPADPGVPDLDSLPTSKLEELLTDDDAFKEYVAAWLQRTPAAKALADIKAQNASIAQENLDMQSAIEEARTHVAIVKSGDYAAMKEMFDELYRRQEQVLAKMGPAVVMQRMQAEVDELDHESDKLLDQFQAGSMSLEQFVEQYAAKRDNFHIADLKKQVIQHHRLGEELYAP